MAYNPRTDLLTPSVGPDTQGIGPGITAGMNNFASLVSQGLSLRNSNQQAALSRDFSAMQDDKRMAAQSAQDDKRFSLMQQRENRMDQKELVTKQEEADFASAAWSSIKQQVPEIITPDLDEKFASGSLGTKRGLLTQTQAAMARAIKDAQDAQRRQEARQPWQAAGPGGVTMYGVGPNVMGKVDGFTPSPNAPPQDTDLWQGSSTDIPVPDVPSYFTNMPDYNIPGTPNAAPNPLPGVNIAPRGTAPAPAGPAPQTAPWYYQ